MLPEDDVDISAEVDDMERLLEKEPNVVDDLPPDEISTEPDEEEDEVKDRKTKRKERGELFRALQATREEQARKDERIAALERQAQALQQSLLQREQPQQQQSDPEGARIRNFLDEKYRLVDALNQEYDNLARANQLTPEEARRLKNEHRKAQEEIGTALALRAARMAQGNTQQVDPRQQAYEAIQLANRTRNPDVYGNQQAIQWAGARYSMLEAELSRGGVLQVDPQELHDRVMNEARSKFGMKRRGDQEPSRADRRRHAGQGRAAATSSGREKRTIRMTSEYKAMADALYGHLPEGERYKKWAQEVGKDLVGT